MLDLVLNTRIAAYAKAGLYRQRRTLDNSVYRIFCSNDYLGLSQHPAVIAALQSAAAHDGVGSGASHLVSGYSEAHQQLELAFASFLKRERALLFTNGYMANLGVMQALMQRGDGIYQDKYNHASLIDAGLLAEATLKRYQHTNLAHLHMQMAKQTIGHKLIVTDSVFSMAGDLAPLPELVQLAKQQDAWLMVDDAHGIGILGNAGAGVCEQFGLSQAEVPILVCPLGKAFGGLGAVVAGSHALIEALIQFARTYIYSTAIPPAIASAMQMSLQLIQTEPERRAKLQSNIAYFREAASARNLAFMPSATPIQCLLVGDINTTMQLSQDLLAKGFVVGAMRPPTVPVNMARLRITLSCLHEQSDMDALLDAIVMSPVYATN